MGQGLRQIGALARMFRPKLGCVMGGMMAIPGLQFGLQFTAVRRGSSGYTRVAWPAERTPMNPPDLPAQPLIRGFDPAA
jgi:hypothetical protein